MLENLKSIFLKAKSIEFDNLIEEINSMYNYAPVDFGGGCGMKKALSLALYIKYFDFKVSIDIGVYRGRSLFPQAIAHKKYSFGTAYGIDPYSNSAAVQNDRPDLKKELDSFAEETDFDKIFNEVNKLLIDTNLTENCKIIRKRSDEVKDFFKNNKIDLGLIHIDGNHDTSFVIQDVVDYLPLLKDNGIIILDDVSWDSVKPAFDLLDSKTHYIGKIIDAENDFAVFLNSEDSQKIKLAKSIFNEISKRG